MPQHLLIAHSRHPLRHPDHHRQRLPQQLGERLAAGSNLPQTAGFGLVSDTWQNGLPVLSIGKYDYTQSLAQLRYAGKKSGLYPADAEAALAVDEVLDIVQVATVSCTAAVSHSSRSILLVPAALCRRARVTRLG